MYRYLAILFLGILVMDLDVGSQSTITGETAHGLTFDSGSALIIATYNNEISAYRAKREWQSILNTYFLLDAERDYEMWVTAVEESEHTFLLTCMFSSACGRYAFWRVINDQSPEAEDKMALNTDTYVKHPARWFQSKRAKSTNKQMELEISEGDAQLPESSKTFVDYLMAFLK